MRLSNRFVPWFFLAPVIAIWILMFAWPVLEVFRLSTLRTNFITSTYVGLANYRDALSSGAFRLSVLTSVAYAFFMIVGSVGGAVVISLMVCRLNKRWQDVARATLFLPSLAAGVVIAQVWRWIYHRDGVLNWLVGLVGIEPVAWFAQPITAIPAVILPIITGSAGGTMIVILAAILGIPEELYDAAIVDGATWTQIKLRIIVPAIRPVIVAFAILAFAASFQIFETIYALAPYDYTATVTYRIYIDAFQIGQYGRASAQAVILLVVISAIMIEKARRA